MAEKSFGIKELNLIGASGTPSIDSPNNLNLNAVNVAISTNVSIGGTLTVTGNISAGGTVTYEDVTNVDSIGIITARQGVRINADSANPAGASATNYLSVGASQDLKLYHNGNQNYISAPDGTLIIQADNIMHVSDDTGGRSIYQDNANSRLELGFDGTAAAYVSSSNVQFVKPITANTDGQHDIGTNSVRFRNAYVDTYYGSGANLTGIAVTEAPVVDYTVTSNGASAYRFHGGGVDETADDPDLYLIRGQKYRFNNTTGTGHPFRFTSTGNKNDTYSNGVTGDEDGVQFWTIPYDAPAKLFYVCTLHAGMVGNIYIRGAGGQNDNVGITTFSTTHPQIVLKDPAGRTVSLRSPSTTYQASLGTDSAHDLLFYTNGYSNEKLRITSSGYVHFGNTGHGTNKVGGQNVTGQDYDPYLKILANTSNHWLMQARSDSTSGNGIFLRSGNSSSTYTLYATGYDENNLHLSVRGDGVIQSPKQVGCAVRMSSNQSHPGNNSFENSSSIMNFDTEVWDIGNNFNGTAKTFTAPVAGRYLCCYTIQIEGISNWLWLYIYPVVNGSNTQTQAKGVVYADMAGNGVTGNSTTTAQYQMFSNTVIMNLAANDEVTLRTRGQISGTIKSGAESQWTMQLLG